MNILISSIVSLIDGIPTKNPLYEKLQMVKNKLLNDVDSFEIHSSTRCHYPSKNLLDTYRKRFDMIKERNNCTQIGLEESIKVLLSIQDTRIGVTGFDTPTFSFSFWTDKDNTIIAFVCIDRK